MAEEIGTIKFSKTDDGIRIDVSGDVMKQMCCCCVPADKDTGSDCCAPADKK